MSRATEFLTDKTTPKPFWQTKRLEEMTQQEWESLCDGCGCCCMHKLEDEGSGDIYATTIGCSLLDNQTCQCSDYKNRKQKMPDCVQLTYDVVSSVRWLPRHCAYRLVYEGKDLEWWHYLKSGSRESVHEAGISMRGEIEAREKDIHRPEDYLDYITTRIWKGRRHPL